VLVQRQAGISEKTWQLTADEDGGPRMLVISSDFYAVYSSAVKKADGLVNLYCWLYCWAHVRRHLAGGWCSKMTVRYQRGPGGRRRTLPRGAWWA
jgi:hypothetical protein